GIALFVAGFRLVLTLRFLGRLVLARPLPFALGLGLLLSLAFAFLLAFLFDGLLDLVELFLELCILLLFFWRQWPLFLRRIAHALPVQLFQLSVQGRLVLPLFLLGPLPIRIVLRLARIIRLDLDRMVVALDEMRLRVVVIVLRLQPHFKLHARAQKE